MSQPAQPRSVIVGGARTPMGRLLGSLKDFSAADLGGIAIKAALERAGITGDQVDYVIMGQVLQAGAGQNPARPAAVAGGIPMSVPSFTLNKVCLSGLDAIALADQLIRAGEFDVVVAGGMESMTNAPHLLPKSREGFKYGDTALVDSMAYDALFDQATGQAMGLLTEECNVASANLTREEQDAFAAASHQKAAAAQKNGVFDDEIVPVEIPQRKGDPIVFAQDEGVRGDATMESLGKLKPMDKNGVVTAGNASQQNDAAAACLVVSEEKLAELGLEPMGWFVGWAAAGCEPSRMGIGPVPAVRKALAKAGLKLADIDLVEVNEAFACQYLAVEKELGLDRSKTNVNGGAIALGHPLGASGTRLVLTALLELRRRGGRYGLASACIGGGQGIAIIFERV